MRGHGEGTVTKRVRKTKDGREVVSWQAALPLENGGRAYRYSRTYEGARDALREMIRAREQGRPVKVPTETVAAFMQRWLEVKEARAPKTHREYANQVRLYINPALGSLKLREIRAAQIQHLISDLATDRPATAQHVLTTLRNAFGLAVQWGLLPGNPAQRVERPKHDPRPVEPLTFEEAAAILAAFQGHRLEAYVTFMFDTGCRPNEALAMTWDQVDLERRIARVVQSLPMHGELQPIPIKTRKGNRTLTLMGMTVAALKRRQAEQRALGIVTPWIFDRGDGEPANESVVYHQVSKHLERCDLRHLSLYELRHGMATLQLENGESLKDISERLGHSTISTTADKYLHVSEGRLRAATERMEKRLSG